MIDKQLLLTAFGNFKIVTKEVKKKTLIRG